MKISSDIRRELDSNNHSVFKLYYHLVLVIKYRRDVVTPAVSEFLKYFFEKVAVGYNITLKEWGYEKDHVHILFSAHPDSNLSKFINAYKSASSRMVKKEFPEIRGKLWKEFFWSRSYCLITAGGASLEILKQYLEGQGGREKKNPGPLNSG